MHYYAFNIADYISHTHHLTPMQDLAYRRMLDHYYLHEKPLANDAACIARLIGLEDRRDDIEEVLVDFFELVDGVYINRRADREIAKYRLKTEAASRAGKASSNARSTTVQPTSASTTVQPTKNQEPVTKNQKVQKRAAARPDDVSEEVWLDFKAQRERQRAPVTDTVLNGFRREAASASLSLEQAMRTCVENGWRGFRADWLKSRANGKPAKPATHIQNLPIGTPSCSCAMCERYRANKEEQRA